MRRALLNRTDLDYALVRLYGAEERSQCPYLNGVPPGVCVSGCWDEPRCITDEPGGDGWASEIRSAADDLAGEARHEARERRGRHGAVKHARDLARWAEKRAIR